MLTSRFQSGPSHSLSQPASIRQEVQKVGASQLGGAAHSGTEESEDGSLKKKITLSFRQAIQFWWGGAYAAKVTQYCGITGTDTLGATAWQHTGAAAKDASQRPGRVDGAAGA
ncbi:hypothetical protein AcV5_009444 [Taiwanofungus camphoratus]|nr:hypothetical protein AcV5_009444 [Antrodia cinnamomea]